MKNELTALRLQKIMAIRDIKAIELADRTGISKASISHYVNGSHVPSSASADKMGKVLKVSPLWLMGYDVPMTEEKSPYYLDTESAKIAQEIYENEDMRILFDAAKGSKASDMRMAAEMLKRFKETNSDG